MKRLRIPETVLDIQRVGVVRGVENVKVAHLVFIGGANRKMTLYLISYIEKLQNACCCILKSTQGM